MNEAIGTHPYPQHLEVESTVNLSSDALAPATNPTFSESKVRRETTRGVIAAVGTIFLASAITLAPNALLQRFYEHQPCADRSGRIVTNF